MSISRLRFFVCALALLASSGCITLAFAHSHKGCGHKFVAHEAKQWSDLYSQQYSQQPTSNSSSSIQPVARKLLQAPKVPIRIWVEYQGTEELSAAGQQRLREVVSKAVAVLQKFYKVRWSSSGNLLVPPLCGADDGAGNCYAHKPDFISNGLESGSSGLNSCGSAVMNSSHIAAYTQCSTRGGCEKFPGGTGEATDYYLYVTALNDEACSSGAAAWALPCLFDPATNRPLLGTANLCRAALEQDSDAAAAVLVHELHHALGFTDQLFDKFIDEAGQPIPKEKVVQMFQTPYGERRAMVITPTVAKEAQAQFGCDTVPGAALEDEGGSGSAMAHWEYKWFQGEIMVATNLFGAHGRPATLSRITLAFMQDSGWYDVNWGEVGFLDWGWQAGCDFVGKTCTAYAAAHPGQQFFCTKEQYSSDNVNTVCTFDGLARAQCAEAPFAEGCAMKVALGTVPNCLSPQFTNRGGTIFGWQNGPGSRCMPVTWPFATVEAQFPDAASLNGATIQDSRCYSTSCTPKGQLQLSILGQTVDCPSGQTIDLAKALPGVFTQGSIGPCPGNAAACGSLACGESCTGDGACVAGKCYCSLHYTGPGCKSRLVPGKIRSSSSAYVPPPDKRVKLPGGAQGPTVSASDGPIVNEASPGDTGVTSDTSDAPVQGDTSGEVPSSDASGGAEVPAEDGGLSAGGVTADDQPISARPVGTPRGGSVAQDDKQGAGAASNSNTVTLSLLLDSSRESLRLSSDRLIMAVAQLAGVDESQVSLQSLPTASTSTGVASSLTLPPPSLRASDSHDVVTNGARNNLRRLAASGAGNDDAVEVRCRIQTGSAKEALDVTRHVSNVARQARFERQLSDSGLQLVPNSLSLVASDGTKVLAAAGSSSGSAGGRGRFGGAAAVVASIAAVLLAALAV
ncbi:hypothetical protein OEZ85_004860 [Tetradesmus obliquus]|uniref:EGF-like domain-containing protein n=1 Tax=Tetradesmus obliquus TaxID=3088 RepID=A0ABY8UJB1_TETOB|nr:hypothetical protein OEZ85_004860 [Tetradesmus obliquus]